MGGVDKHSLTRRALMERAVYLVGGAAALDTFCASSVLAEASEAPRFFSKSQYAALEHICDIIIPETDTPGALGVGVPALVDQMMVDWASDASKAQWLSVLDGVEAEAKASFGKSFLALSQEQRMDTVAAYDKAALNGGNGAYRRFKQLVLVGYYHSEIGATQELRFELVPGAWRADIPFAEIGRAWAD